MVFSSSIFLTLFLPICLAVYLIAPEKFKNYVLLAFSLFFYSWGGARFLVLLLISIGVDFFLVKMILRNKSVKRKYLYLAIAVGVNALTLIYFKYTNFFLENVYLVADNLGFNLAESTLNVVLPIGISFFTFQKISYVVDVYRGKAKAFDNIFNYALYIMMFPQLIAGPIVRFQEISEQILGKRKSDIDHKLWGFFRFTQGLAKKVLLADVLALTVNQIFAINPAELAPLTAWIGIVAYSMQIYFDFSGYSDMAIGIGSMLGYRFPENFNFPYLAQNITEFWRRWHITLSNWFKEYVYIPLGGNRVSSWKQYRNLITVFLLSGLWHGAAWTFVIWGGLHGMMLMLEKRWLLKLYKRTPKLFNIFINFLIVNIAWVFFRAEDVNYALDYIKQMFTISTDNGIYDFSYKFGLILPLSLIIAFSPLLFGKLNTLVKIYGNQLSLKASLSLFITAGILFGLSLAAVHGNAFSPFIYFRF